MSAVLARLNRPDARALLARHDDADANAVAANAEAETLRGRLEDLGDAAAAGTISMEMLGRAEKKLRTEIGIAEVRARRCAGSTALDKAIGLSREDWGELPIQTRREIVRELCAVTIMPAGRGHRVFDPRLVKIRWH